MSSQKVSLRPGSVVVFEGLDKAGKSTQLDLLRAAVDPRGVTFTHMPSGLSGFTAGLYALLEDKATSPSDSLARQLAHLACHRESMTALIETKQDGALVLDRWWWSTLAYGWYGRGDTDIGITEGIFRALIDSIWEPIRADAVFLFLHAYEMDDNNVDGVATGYQTIADQSTGPVIRVPAMPELESHEYIVAELSRLSLTA